MKEFFAKRILPAVTLEDEDRALKVAEAFLESGLHIMEVPFRTKEAADCIKSIRSHFPEIKIGAGTILSVTQLHEARDSGAQFGLAPGFNPKVVKEAFKLDFPFIPGVMTPTEIELALELQCTMLKLFPVARLGGIEMLRSLQGPYGHTGIKFIPMGGVDMGNMQAYLKEQNVIAVGGSWLAGKELIREKNYDAIRRNTVEALRMAGF